MEIAALQSWVEHNSFIIQVISCSLTLVTLIMLVLTWLRLRKYRYLLKGETARNFEELLLNLTEKTNLTYAKLNQLEERVLKNEVIATKNIQNWNLLRFKAFQNTGSDQSFSLALLDAAGDGVVISSIFGREESRVYGKLVQNGGSSHPLSEEEKTAIAKAFGKKK